MNHYPDSFHSLDSSGGHIGREDLDMDTHDRAVRRSAGRHSRKSSSLAPLWLVCILLFVGLVGFFLIRIPAKIAVEPEAVVVTEPEPEPEPSTPALVVVEPVTVTPEPEIAVEPEPEIVIEPEPVPENHVHRYVSGVCSLCGAKPEFLTDWLPDEFYQDSSQPGTLESHEYDTKAYASYSFDTYHKTLNVYLPYGYDSSRPYNVLILIHGQGDDQDAWLKDTHESGGRSMQGKVILDNMIEKGICEPCIVVTPVTETPQCQGLTAGIVQMRDEIREVILPWIVENYSTYAEDSSLESIRAARSHFGLGGLSNGALFVFEGGMRCNFDLFGSWAAFSGNGEPWKTVSAIQEEAYRDLPVDCFFAGAGTMNDWQQHYTEIGFDYFVEKDERFREGENAWRVDVEGQHEWKVWFTGLYNAMQVMFQTLE